MHKTEKDVSLVLQWDEGRFSPNTSPRAVYMSSTCSLEAAPLAPGLYSDPCSSASAKSQSNIGMKHPALQLAGQPPSLEVRGFGLPLGLS